MKLEVLLVPSAAAAYKLCFALLSTLANILWTEVLLLYRGMERELNEP
jgi:hypothetical protein